jgi:hypothetical protein
MNEPKAWYWRIMSQIALILFAMTMALHHEQFQLDDGVEFPPM